MKKLALLFGILLFSLPLRAQTVGTPSNPFGGDIRASSAACATAASCVWQKLPSTATTLTATITGTFVATLQFEQSSDGITFAAASPASTSTTGVTTFTVTSFTDFRVRASAYVSGTASVNLQASGNQLSVTVNTGGSSISPTAIGPVINVANPAYSGCSATPIADYTTCFTSIAAATATASKVSVGTPTVRSSCAVPMPTATQTTLTTAGAGSTCPGGVSIPAGDTIIVGILASSGGSYSVTDAAGNNYFMLNLKTPVAASPVEITVFATGAGVAKALSGLITVTSSPATNYGLIIMDASTVGSFGQLNIINTATSVTPTNVKANFTTTTTQDNNNIVATFIAYCPGAVVTISANTGTLQNSYNGSATNCGGGLVTNTSATPAVVTTSATLSVSKLWVTSTLELRSVQTTVPTIYFPYQSTPYYYASGLNFLSPVKLKGDPGSVLWYTGTAHAIDLGPNNLTIANYQFVYYTIDGLTFEGGGSMTQGIFINDWVILVEISNNQFLNFGNSTSWGVWANGDQNDIYMHDNKFVVNDGASNILTTANDTIIRHWVNITTQPTAITLRFVNNSAACLNGLTGNVGCSFASLDTPLLSLIGLTHDISHNNFMGGFCPAIALGANDNNTKISYNHIETQLSGCYAITFSGSGVGTGVNGLRVFNNYFRQASTSGIGPRLVGDTLMGATIRDNYFTALPAGVPIVTLNNLAGQINNLASGNMCETTSQGYAAPCPIIHTAGGNITPWNADYAGTCTLVNPTGCPAYNFLVTYTVAPKCNASWTGTGTFTGILKAAASTTQLKIDSTVTTDTGVVSWSCNPEAQ